MTTRTFLSLGFGLLSLASACSTNDSTNIGRVSQPIINGTDSVDAQNGVVLIAIEATGPGAPPGGICTGSLIAPNLVLTARHCVSQGKGEAGFACSENGKTDDDNGASAPGADYAPSAFKIFTGKDRQPEGTTPRAVAKKVIRSETDTLCGNDLALLLLDASITDVPVIKVRTEGAVTIGEVATAVGWGVTQNEEAPPAVRKQRTGVTVQRVGPTAADLPAGEFTVGEAICSGDSGGPLISDATGEVIGVVSRGGNNEPDDPNNVAKGCHNGTNYYQGTIAFKTLIESALAEAKGQPVVPSNPSIPGDGGTSSSGATDAPAAAEDSGCSTTNGTSSSSYGSSLALGLAAMLVLGARRRKR